MPTPFEQRMETTKAEIAERTRASVTEMLDKHYNLLTAEVKEQMIAKEVEAKLAEYEQARMEGKANDNYCEEPGITIYVDREGMQGKELEILNGYGIHFTEVGDKLIRINLPDGTYSMGMGACQFYGNSRGEKPEQPFFFPYSNVVRVEADNGQMWQNMNQDWNSLDKTPQEMEDKNTTSSIESNEVTDLAVKVEQGDIGQIKADALLAPINSGGMWFGAIDGVIQRNGGRQFHEQASKALPLSHGETVIARSNAEHKGGFDDVVFVIDDLESPLGEVFYNALKSAEEAGYKSVTVPTMRMGVMLGAVEKTPEATIQEMKTGFERFKRENPSSLQDVTIVVYNDPETKSLVEKTFQV